jgi:hypothetical protein
MDEVPLPEHGVLRKGVIYRVPAPRGVPRRPLDQETLDTIARVQRKLIREYLEKKRGS